MSDEVDPGVGAGAAADGAATALSVDVAVVGAGPVGSLAALAAAEAGHRVALIAPAAGRDPRTTALLMPSVVLLEALGVWLAVAQAAAPLRTMRIVDDTGRLPRAPEVAFDAHELGAEAFGYNVPNDALGGALAALLAAGNVVRVEAAATGYAPGAAGTVLTDAGPVRASLVVAADGANSVIRRDAAIGARRWSYDQAAFVTTLSHERPHNETSVEFHTDSGPFTLVPLPGLRSSLVWVGRPDDVARRARLDPGPLAREIEGRARGILGRMAVDGPRGVLPMEGLVAHRFGAGRVVLVGEAAHKFPPIGAQGLNLGYRDVAALRALLRRRLDEVPPVYDLRRRADVALRTVSVDLLNRSLLTGFFVPTLGRVLGMAAARNVGPVRRAMMRFGLGAV